MPSRRRRFGATPRTSPEALAGWLFADLLLVLFIIGIGSGLTIVLTDDPAPPGPTEDEPAVVIPPPPPSMRLDPIHLEVGVDAATLLSSDPATAQAARAALNSDIAAQTAGLTGQRSAMVLTWGHATTPTTGQDLARVAIAEMTAGRPDVFGGSASKALWLGDPRSDRIELEIYLFQ